MHIIPTSPFKVHQRGRRGSKSHLLRRKLSRLTVMITGGRLPAVLCDLTTFTLTLAISIHLIFFLPYFISHDLSLCLWDKEITSLKWCPQSVDSSLDSWQRHRQKEWVVKDNGVIYKPLSYVFWFNTVHFTTEYNLEYDIRTLYSFSFLFFLFYNEQL